ncbi:SIR2 family protein [Anaerolineales bacterium HSG25]|nr:SIR2 family protein [Anaerolineales bacterium HSG25]
MIRRRRSSQKETVRKPDDSLDTLCERIEKKQVIPIISNSLRLKAIFQKKLEREDINSKLPFQSSITEQLAVEWAKDIDYPLPDSYRLEGVARYKRVTSLDLVKSKTDYLRFLKTILLDLADSDTLKPDDSVLTSELENQLHRLTVSDVTTELDYPRYEAKKRDPLRQLAQLQLPIYITTSHHDFLARMIEAEGRSPQRQVCEWTKAVPISEQPPPKFRPTAENPLVYHLFGLEKYPASLVLSEDDHLDFLYKMAQTNKTTDSIIPLYLAEKLAESSLMLLGYRLYDWDFRTLFRLLNAIEDGRRMNSLMIQLDPKTEATIPSQINGPAARNYLAEYLDPKRYRMMWGESDTIINQIWEAWQTWKTQ